jgi:hypothetical protein
MIHPCKPLDAYARVCIAGTPGVIVSWWLMASFLYYVRDISLLTDAYYDELCRDLDTRWCEIEHQHKHLIDRAALDAGTGFYLTEDQYPLRVIGAAEYILSAGPPRMPGEAHPALVRPAKPQGDLFA